MQILALEDEGTLSNLTTRLLRTLKPHSTPVVSISIDNSGTLVATGSSDGVIKVWDIREGYVTHTFRGHKGVISALHLFEDTRSQIEPQTASKGKRTKRKNSEPVGDNLKLANGDEAALHIRLASGSEDGKIRIWDLLKRKSIALLDSHVSVVRGLCFSSEQNTLLSSSRDKTITQWDAHTWTAARVIPTLEGVESVGFLLCGEYFYTGGEAGKLRIWVSATGKELTLDQPITGEGREIVHILPCPHLDFLLCVHADQVFVLHTTATLQRELPIDKNIEPLPILRRISGTHDEIIDLAYMTPQRSLLALATNSEDIRLVSLARENSDRPQSAAANYFGADVALLSGHEDIIICLDVDWSGCWIATGAKDNTARLWRIDQGNELYQHYATFTGHAESLGAISLPSQLSQPGSGAYTNPLDHPPTFLLTGSQDKTVKRWNIPKPNTSKTDRAPSRAFYTRKAHDKDINAISTNHNSTRFASASQDRTVKIWSVEDGEVQGVLRGHRRGVWSVKFAPKDLPPIQGENSGPASSSRGLVLTGSGDKTIKIWSLTDYSCLRTLEGHTNSVLKVLWMPLPNPDDSNPTATKYLLQIASAGGDGLVKVWDANSGEVVCTLDNHTDRIWALTVDPADRTLVSGGGDSVVTFWKDTTSNTMAATAAASTARMEQEQQLMNYMHAGSYREAITLALSLNHPARLLALFQEVVGRSPPEEGSLSGLKAVDEVIANLADEQLLELLRRVRDWNTNARTSAVAQRVLNVVVRSYPAEKLAGLRGKGAKEVVDGLRAYTERHYKRVEELMDESYLLEYTLREMEEVGFVNGDGVEDRMIMA